MRFPVPLFLIFLPVILSSQTNSGTSISLFEKEVVFPVDTLRSNYQLPDSLLLPDSEKIWADSTLLHKPKDYIIDYWNGSLVLSPSLPKSAHLKVQYQIFPFALKRAYFRRELVVENSGDKKQESANNPSLVSRNPVTVQENVLANRLRKSGSIIRGLSVGTNQGLKVDSGLRMQLSGKLTDDIEIVASLTDQNTPIQPEGNTQSLQEIDKVFVQIKGPKFQATLGDYNLNLGGTEFTNYNRKLEGVMGHADFGKASFTVSGAVSRGQFTTSEFMGQEGNQGPYQLRGSDGQINIIVLAGTERVWIDGEQMTRGENHDYVIEYGNGQITFTRNRLITGDSRITVDFQFSDESFQRNFWAVQGETNWLDGKLKFGATFIRESDDKDDPLRFTLSDEFQNALESAGDSLAIIPGDTLVGEGKGTYLKDSTGVFIYVGPNLGDYFVSFSYFGENQGDYRNIGLGRFEYAGENQGAYRPFIILPKARRHDVVGFNVRLSPTSFLDIKSELALSQLDANLYSSKDDGNNRGAAYNVRFNFKPTELKFGRSNLGKFNFSGKLRRKSENYRDIDRTTIAEFNRRWDIPNTATSSEENIAEFQGTYEPLQGWLLRGGLGRLSKSSTFKSNRWDLMTRLNKRNFPKLDYFVEFISRDNQGLKDKNTWLRQKGKASYQIRILTPIFEYEGEIKKETGQDTTDFGFRFDSYTGGLNLSPWKFLSASAKYNVRDDKDRIAGVFQPKSIAKTQAYSLNLKRWHAVSVTASYIHRDRNFNGPGIQDTRTDLADVRIGYSPRNRGVRANVYYQISTKQIARQEEIYIEVAEGDGNFRFNEDLQEFEPDPFGNFVKRILTTNNFVPVVELRMRTDLRLAPGKFIESRFLNPITTETFLRIDERTRERDVAKIYLLNFDHFQQDTTTIFGSIEVRQDVYLWQRSRKFSVRYRYRNRKELNNQLIAGGQKRNVFEQGIRTLYQFSQLVSSQVEFIRSAEDRIFQSITREDRKVRSNQIDLDLVFRPQKKLEIGLKSQASFNKDIVPAPNTTANLISFAPRSNYSFNQKGRLRAEIEWTKVTVAPKGRLIPYELTEGKRAGTTFRWNLGFDYRVSRNVQVSLNYFGRKEPDRPKTQHIAKVEMRAFF